MLVIGVWPLAQKIVAHVTASSHLQKDRRRTTCWSARQESIEGPIHFRRGGGRDGDIADVARADVQRQAPTGVQHQNVSGGWLPLSCRASRLDSRNCCSADREGHLQHEPVNEAWPARLSAHWSRRRAQEQNDAPWAASSWSWPMDASERPHRSPEQVPVGGAGRKGQLMHAYKPSLQLRHGLSANADTCSWKDSENACRAAARCRSRHTVWSALLLRLNIVWQPGIPLPRRQYGTTHLGRLLSKRISWQLHSSCLLGSPAVQEQQKGAVRPCRQSSTIGCLTCRVPCYKDPAMSPALNGRFCLHRFPASTTLCSCPVMQMCMNGHAVPHQGAPLLRDIVASKPTCSSFLLPYPEGSGPGPAMQLNRVQAGCLEAGSCCFSCSGHR